MFKCFHKFTNINIMRMNNNLNTLNTPCVALDNRFFFILEMKSVSKEYQTNIIFLKCFDVVNYPF